MAGMKQGSREHKMEVSNGVYPVSSCVASCMREMLALAVCSTGRLLGHVGLTMPPPIAVSTSLQRLRSKKAEINKAVGVYEVSLKVVEDLTKEAVEIVEKDPDGNQDLLATLSRAKDVFDGEVRPADQRVFDHELAVVSLSQGIERLQDEVRAGFDAATRTEGGALKMVTGLVQRQIPAMKELRKGQQRAESVLKQVHSKTVAGHAQMGGQLTSIMGMLQKLVDRDETGGSAAKSISAQIATPLRKVGGEGEKDARTPDVDASGQSRFDAYTVEASAEAEKSLSLAGFQTPTGSKGPATQNLPPPLALTFLSGGAKSLSTSPIVGCHALSSAFSRVREPLATLSSNAPSSTRLRRSGNGMAGGTALEMRGQVLVMETQPEGLSRPLLHRHSLTHSLSLSRSFSCSNACSAAQR
jgi:hypothetical protein